MGCTYVMETDAPAHDDESTSRCELISSANHGKQCVKVWADHKRCEAAVPRPSGSHDSVTMEA